MGCVAGFVELPQVRCPGCAERAIGLRTAAMPLLGLGAKVVSTKNFHARKVSPKTASPSVDDTERI